MATITTHGDLIRVTDETTITIMAPAELVEIPRADWLSACEGLPTFPEWWDIHETASAVVWTLSRLPEWDW